VPLPLLDLVDWPPCPLELDLHHHGFKGIAQLNIFHNDLRSDTKMLLDAAAGGMMMIVDVNRKH